MDDESIILVYCGMFMLSVFFIGLVLGLIAGHVAQRRERL